MGRSHGARDKWRCEVESVRRKSSECRPHQMVREQFRVCEAEAVSVVRGCLDYLRLGGPSERGPLDIRADVPAGRGLGWKVSVRSAPVRSVVLSPPGADDAELMLDAGVRAVQSARAVRLVEQAERGQGLQKRVCRSRPAASGATSGRRRRPAPASVDTLPLSRPMTASTTSQVAPATIAAPPTP